MIRIDRADRDMNELLDPANWVSCNWGGDTMRDCNGCEDCQEDEAYRGETHWRCYGERELEDTRYGISVMANEDALIEYLATVGPDMDNCVLVEVEGDYSDEDGHDAHLGELLILPTKVVSIRPVDDDFVARVFAKIDEKEA
jgi:hypothetical protein